MPEKMPDICLAFSKYPLIERSYSPRPICNWPKSSKQPRCKLDLPMKVHWGGLQPFNSVTDRNAILHPPQDFCKFLKDESPLGHPCLQVPDSMCVISVSHHKRQNVKLSLATVSKKITKFTHPKLFVKSFSRLL